METKNRDVAFVKGKIGEQLTNFDFGDEGQTSDKSKNQYFNINQFIGVGPSVRFKTSNQNHNST